MKNRILGQKMPTPSNKGLVLLTGARQTGKTTLVKHLYPELRYINFDAIENREKIALVHSDEWAKVVGPAIIDEAQKWPLVFEKIKYAYDANELSFSVLLGSAQILLLKNIRETLAGRISIFELYPLMLCELIADQDSQLTPPLFSKLIYTHSVTDLLNSTPKVIFNNEQIIKNWEKHLLSVGGMPLLLSLSDQTACFNWIRDYEQTYLERDLSDLARLHDLQPFRTFQKLSALRSSQLINYSELARDAKVSVDTAKRYLEYLKLSYQVFLLQPYHKNLTSTLVKTPKLYWLDIGILRSLINFQGDVTGQLFETYVVAECMKWIKTNKERTELYFYRTRSGLEVDLIIETPNGIIAAEVKSKKNVDHHDAGALTALQQSAPNCLGCIIIYMGDEIKEIKKDIWAIPSWRLFS